MTLAATPNSESTRFGSGWISGVLSVTLGAMGFAAVLCLLFPSLLTTPERRQQLMQDAMASADLWRANNGDALTARIVAAFQ